MLTTPKDEKYFKTPGGEYSSTRKNGTELLRFFYIFNIIIWPLIALLSYGDSSLKLDPNWLVALLSFDSLLLIAIFVPKQLKNLSEVKEIVELAKTGAPRKKIEQ